MGPNFGLPRPTGRGETAPGGYREHGTISGPHTATTDRRCASQLLAGMGVGLDILIERPARNFALACEPDVGKLHEIFDAYVERRALCSLRAVSIQRIGGSRGWACAEMACALQHHAFARGPHIFGNW